MKRVLGVMAVAFALAGVQCGSSDQATGVADADDAGVAGAAPGGEAGSADGVGGSSTGAECGDVTYAGTCRGSTYVWCDYFTGGLHELDCAALGLTCRADSVMPYEDFTNGCVGEVPDLQLPTCNGRLIYQASGGELHVRDCEHQGGPGSVCREEHDEFADYDMAWCTDTLPCTTTGETYCDGNFIFTCIENGYWHVSSCAAHGLTCGPSGTERTGSICCVYEDGACFPR